MASVYRAYEAKLDRTVALRVLPEDLLDQSGFLDRFEREARVIAHLEHPHIVPVYASGIDEGQPWMALRLVRGGNLGERMEEGEGLDREAGLRYLANIADALDFAHAKGIVHRDLKPQNILLGDRGECYIADFGIASLLSGATRLTQTGAALGTPQYMAPEQAKGEAVGPPADIYALGVIAYHWLAGELPFDADTPYAVMFKHVSAPLPMEPLRGLPERAQEVLVRVLAKQPADRWASAGEFVRALFSALGEPVQEAPAKSRRANTVPPPRAATPPPPSQRAPERKPAANAEAGPSRSIGSRLATLAAVLVIGLGSWGGYRWWQAKGGAEPMPVAAAEAERLAVARKAAAGTNAGFEDVGNGRLRDSQTGLTWTQSDNGSDIDWNGANSYCQGKGMRLPSIDELAAIYGRAGGGTAGCGGHTCKVSPLFRLTSFWFWSGTMEGSSRAFTLYLYDGSRYTDPLGNAGNLRALCVGRS